MGAFWAKTLRSAIIFSNSAAVLCSCLSNVLGAIRFGSTTIQLNVSGVTTLRATAHCLFSDMSGLIGPGSVTSIVASVNAGVSSLAVFGCLGKLTTTFVLCPIQRCSVGSGHTLQRRHVCCTTSLNVHYILYFGGMHSAKHLLRGILFLRLVHVRKRTFIKRDTDKRVSFVAGNSSKPQCRRIDRSIHSPRTLRQRLSSLHTIHSNCPGALVALSSRHLINRRKGANSRCKLIA